MERLTQIWTVLRRVLCSRVLAAVVMGMFTLSIALGVAVNSRTITVTDGEESRVVITMHEDPYRVLSSAGVTLDEHDTVDVNASGSAIDVNRAMAVEVRADGISTLLHMTEGTAADALEGADVTVGKYDTLNVKPDTPVSEGMLIQVDRVQYEEYKVTKPVDYEVVYKYTSVLKPGQTKVRTYGKEGVRTITYRKIIVNGEVTETEQVSDKVTTKPVNKVILKGTKLGTPMSKHPTGIELDEGGQPVKYKKCLTGQATAYTADGGDSGSWTSTGKHVAVGLVAVNPKVIPYGSKLWITSADGSLVYGYAIAADTGGACMRNKILVDLYMDTLAECNAFGRRNMNVYILE